jgi:hypothetical protein
MKKIFSILIMITIIFYCCGKQSDQKKSKQNEQKEIQEELINSKYNEALSLAHKNQEEGLLLLFKIATDDLSYGVETSEIATEELHRLFFVKTVLWIGAFSKLDSAKTKTFFEFLDYSGIVDGVYADDAIQDRETYCKMMLSKVNEIHVDNNGAKLIEYLNKLLRRK